MSVVVVNSTPAYQGTSSNRSSQSYSSVKSGSDGFDGPKKEKKHRLRNFLVAVGAVTTAFTLAIGAITAWHSPKLAADMLRNGKWKKITHGNVGSKCAEFSEKNEKFAARVSKWSLPTSVKTRLFSWPGKFWESTAKHFPENSALQKYAEHKSTEYKASAEKLKESSPRPSRRNSLNDEDAASSYGQYQGPIRGYHSQSSDVPRKSFREYESLDMTNATGMDWNSPRLRNREDSNIGLHHRAEGSLVHVEPEALESEGVHLVDTLSGSRRSLGRESIHEEGLGQSYFMPRHNGDGRFASQSPSLGSQTRETDLDFMSDAKSDAGSSVLSLDSDGDITEKVTQRKDK